MKPVRGGMAALLLMPVLLLAPPALADSADFDLGSEVSGYRRFIVYPHLEKGFAAQRAGQRERALAEFARARELLPEHPLVAVHYAGALRQFGEPERARALLEQQRRLTPEDARVLAALAAFAQPVAVAPAREACAGDAAHPACRLQQGRAALDRGDVPAAEAALVAPGMAGSKEALTLRRALLQRALHLRDWARAETHFRALDAAGVLAADERAQWFTALLAQGRRSEAEALQRRSGPLSAPARLALAQAAADAGDRAGLRQLLAAPAPVFDSAAGERQWLVLLEKVARDDLALLAANAPRHDANHSYHARLLLPGLLAAGRHDEARVLLARLPAGELRETRFELALAQGDVAAAEAHARALRQAAPQDMALLDRLSFGLQQAGAGPAALGLLLPAWPYAGEVQPLLQSRLALLAGDHPEAVEAAARARLRTPLATPALRGAQAAVLARLGECEGVVAVLGDLDPAYGHDDYLRLGDCLRLSRPGLAQLAYAEAQARRASRQATLALAYQAQANRDDAAAMAAWQALPVADVPAADRLAAANTALEAGDSRAARRWLDAYAEAGGAQDAAYWWARARADRAEDPLQARVALDNALRLGPQAEHHAALAALLDAEGQPAAALAERRRAVALAPQEPEWRRQLADALGPAGQAREARDLYEGLLAATPGDEALLQQLTYTSQQQGDSVAARAYARQSIDALDAADGGVLALTPAETDTRYNLRRLHEELGRRWVLSADLLSGSALAAAATGSNPGERFRSYFQAEAEYRPGAGRWFARPVLTGYARVFAGGGEEESALPVYSPMLALGLRLRPLATQDVVLAVEQQLPLDHGPDTEADVMLRASATLFGGGRYSNEWQPRPAGWLTQGLYLDAAWFVEAERSVLTADYRLGWHEKLGHGRTLEPYGHLQYSVSDDGAARSEDSRVGVGLRWHLWWGETLYDAWPHKAVLGLEYQHALSTALDERDSLVLILGVRW